MKPKGRHPVNALTAKQVEKKKQPGRHADGNGLYLVVDPPDETGKPGAKRWLLRTVVQGRRRDIGLGSAQLVSLANAREKAREMRAIARDGGDPLVARRAQQAIPTFKEAAETVHDERKAGWKNGKHQNQWISTLEIYAFPVIGTRRVDQVTGSDIHTILQPIWHAKSETARRVRQRLGTVMDWATAHGHRTGENPVRLTALSLGAQKDKNQENHHPALPYTEVPEFIRWLGTDDKAVEAVRLLLEFNALTAVRPGEARGAMLDEFNLQQAIWVVPASRMKAGKEHRVPLPRRCIEIVERATALGGDYLFPGARRGKPLSENTAIKCLRRFAPDYTVHGLRSSFRDWAGEQTSFPREVCEAALAHVIKNKAEAAYARSDLFEKRRKLMEAWAKYLEPHKGSVVVPLRTTT